MTKTAHTALPWWHSEELSRPHCQLVYGGADRNLCADVGSNNRSEQENKANAKFIVLACNSYYELLEALQAIATENTYDYIQKHNLTPSIDLNRNLQIIAEHAVNKATGITPINLINKVLDDAKG